MPPQVVIATAHEPVPDEWIEGKRSGNECVFCGGPMGSDAATFSFEDEEGYVLVEHVPAEVCGHCGEKVYTPEVTDALLEIA